MITDGERVDGKSNTQMNKYARPQFMALGKTHHDTIDEAVTASREYLLRREAHHRLQSFIPDRVNWFLDNRRALLRIWAEVETEVEEMMSNESV